MQNQSLNEEAIFQIARRIQPPEALSAYLDQACGADRSLHARVKALLGTPGDADRGPTKGDAALFNKRAASPFHLSGIL